MTEFIRPPRRHVWTRGILALGCAAVMAMTGLPSLDSAEAAKPPALKPGKRCDELFGLKGTPTKSLPQRDGTRAKELWDQYEYVNPGMEFDGLNPTQDELDAAGKDYKQYPHSDPRRIYARFNAQKRWTNFDDYLISQYIPNQGNDPRGEAFEKKVVKEMGLTGPDWICQKEVYFTEPDPNDPNKTVRHKRVLDAYNKKTREIVEMKSNGKPDGSQTRADKAWARHKGWNSYKYTFVFGEQQKSEARTFMKDMKDAAGKDAQGRDRVRAYNFHSDHKPQAPKGTENGPYRRSDPFLSNGAGKNTGSRGGGNNVINQSPPTPKDLKERLDRLRAADPQGRMQRGFGGVDFSTLDLRYIGKPVKGEGLNYAFSAKRVEDEYAAGWGGKEKAQLISDAFFTWLALTPDKFWVNLNPDEPERVMDAEFGKTDAGRILLEADLQMKHDFFKTMDPKTDLGKRFWASLPKVNGRPCFAGIRNWIEPQTATVREQDGGIHILDAPLQLKSTPQDFTTDPGGEQICNPSKAERDEAQRVIDRMIVPEVEKTINTAPQYADLRRVYTARVAAEFIRQQDAKAPTDYHSLINSNNVAKWPLRAPNQNWDKNELFQKYRQIFLNGEFEYDVETAEGVLVYIVGGVDFSKQPKRNMDTVRFRAEHPYKPRTAQFAVGQMTDDADQDGYVMLGGNTAGKTSSDDDATPTPTPTDDPGDKPTDKPTDTPSTPAPSTSPGGNDDNPTPPAKDPDGDLADTGSDTPIGLITAIAAAVAAAGGALMWWVRRRKAEQA